MLRTKLEYNEFLFVFPEVVGLQQVLTKADPGSHTSPRRIWRERNWEQESVCLPIMATAEWTQLTAKTAVLIWSPNGKGEDRQSKEEAKISTVSSQGTVGLDPCRKRERERMRTCQFSWVHLSLSIMSDRRGLIHRELHLCGWPFAPGNHTKYCTWHNHVLCNFLRKLHLLMILSGRFSNLSV